MRGSGCARRRTPPLTRRLGASGRLVATEPERPASECGFASAWTAFVAPATLVAHFHKVRCLFLLLLFVFYLPGDRGQHHCLHVPLLLLQEGVADVDGSCGLVMLELQHAALPPCRAHQGWRAPGFYHEPNGVVGGLHMATQGRTYALVTRRRRA